MSSDLAHNILEGIVDIDPGFGRSFNEGTTELTGQVFPLCDPNGVGQHFVSLASPVKPAEEKGLPKTAKFDM